MSSSFDRLIQSAAKQAADFADSGRAGNASQLAGAALDAARGHLAINHLVILEDEAAAALRHLVESANAAAASQLAKGERAQVDAVVAFAEAALAAATALELLDEANLLPE